MRPRFVEIIGPNFIVMSLCILSKHIWSGNNMKLYSQFHSDCIQSRVGTDPGYTGLTRLFRGGPPPSTIEHFSNRGEFISILILELLESVTGKSIRSYSTDKHFLPVDLSKPFHISPTYIWVDSKASFHDGRGTGFQILTSLGI